jgi:tRNA-dihydrouridine synthase A
MTKETVLWTEMIHANAVLRSLRKEYFLERDGIENVIYQLGGSDPETMAQAASVVESYGYSEVNVNCGCPSGKAEKGEFGACLMLKPDLICDIVQ